MPVIVMVFLSVCIILAGLAGVIALLFWIHALLGTLAFIVLWYAVYRVAQEV